MKVRDVKFCLSFFFCEIIEKKLKRPPIDIYQTPNFQGRFKKNFSIIFQKTSLKITEYS